MALVSLGVSRQAAHEEIRVLSHEAGRTVKVDGGANDLIDRIRRTPFFAPVAGQLDELLDPATFIGRCPQQVEKFLDTEVSKALGKYGESIHGGKGVELEV